MPTDESSDSAPLQNRLASGEPLTHFFYEYQGEREVDPLLLVENAITLWHEQVFANAAHDNGHLWDLAAAIVQDRERPPMYSWVEWVRYRITTGAFIPANWNVSEVYPYKGLLISAIYLHESKRLCEEGQMGRVWHLIALAYYNLGINTGSSTRLNTSRAAQIGHAERSEGVRALVLTALDKIKNDQSANSIEKAKDKVVELLREREGRIKHWLSEFDDLVSEKTKGRSKAKQKNDVLDRIRNMLDDWALPSGPYPEVAKAFSHFSKRKGTTQTRSDSRTNQGVPMEDADYYMRLINFLEDGNLLTVKLARQDP